MTTDDWCKNDAHGNGTTFDGVLLPCRSCSRSAIDTLQRHTLHLQVREASWLSLNRSIVGKYTINPTLMKHAGHRAYKKVDQSPCDSYAKELYQLTCPSWFSTKSYDEFGNWQHEKIELKPLNRDYNPIVITPDDADEFRVIGEFVGVLRFK